MKALKISRHVTINSAGQGTFMYLLVSIVVSHSQLIQTKIP
jgi:hypothetical protein